MKAKNCLIFGGTGQIGSNLLRKLAKNNFKVTVVTRNLHQKGNFIKTQANAGYIEIIETNPFNETSDGIVRPSNSGPATCPISILNVDKASVP